MAASATHMVIRDGIQAWYRGPEWDMVAEESMHEFALMIQEDAQQNAPWEDRTGDARSGLTAQAHRDAESVYIELFHTVDYGQWLEVIQNGRFAIILPTLEHWSDRVMVGTAEAVSHCRRGQDFI